MKVRRPVKEVAAGVQARADGGLNQVAALETVKTGQVGNTFLGTESTRIACGLDMGRGRSDRKRGIQDDFSIFEPTKLGGQ